MPPQGSHGTLVSKAPWLFLRHLYSEIGLHIRATNEVQNK